MAKKTLVEVLIGTIASLSRGRETADIGAERRLKTTVLSAELEVALATEEIKKGLESIGDGSITQEYVREHSRRQFDQLTTKSSPEFSEYLEWRKKLYLRAENDAHRYIFASSVIDRLLISIGVGLIVLAFLPGVAPQDTNHANSLFGYSSVVILETAAFGYISLRKRFEGPTLAGFLGVGVALGEFLAIASIVHSQKLSKGQHAFDASSVLLIFGAPCIIALAVAYYRRSATGSEVPTGVKSPPLVADILAPTIISAAGIITLAGVYLLGGGASRVIVGPYPNYSLVVGAIFPILVGVVHALSTVRLQPRKYLIAESDRAESLARAALMTQDIMPTVREILNSFVPNQRTEFIVGRAPGLSEAFDPLFEISTRSVEKVGELLGTMPGGAIGIAGSRGVGKTTLINSYCDSRPRRIQGAGGGLTATVSAPVQYAARDFLLNLYVQLCRRALHYPVGSVQPVDPSATMQSRRARLTSLAYGFAVLATGMAILLLRSQGVGIDSVTAWATFLLLLGLMFITQSFVRRSPIQRTSPSRPSLEIMARSQLQEIFYQYKISGSWSGSAKSPIGLEGTLGGGHEFARRELSLPEIVLSIRDFLTVAARQGRVIIGIDELDKMESETVAIKFLNEIKGIFGIANCFFLVSISEDAMSGFERRGLPFRDVFDSSLDEVVRLDPLTFREAEQLLNRRVLSVPTPFKELLFVLSGGLARDLIRDARELVAVAGTQPKETVSLDGAARLLVGRDLRKKMLAAAHSLRGPSSEPIACQVIEWCLGVSALGTPDSRALSESLKDLDKICTSATQQIDQPVISVVKEMSSYIYFCLTILEVFYQRSREPGPGANVASHEAFIVSLAQAKSLFSTNLDVGWNQISKLRMSHGLDLEVKIDWTLTSVNSAGLSGGPSA